MQKLFSFLTLVLVFGMMSYLTTGCSDHCDDGNCDCPVGFSGTNCQVEDLCIKRGTDCLNGGTCLNGTCLCPAGFTGPNCETSVVSSLCSTIVCQNGGKCSGGICSCTIGFEGAFCETMSRSKFLGTFSALSNCNLSGKPSYTLTLSEHPTAINGLILNGIWNNRFNAPVTAILNTSAADSTVTSFIIPNQNPDNGAFFIEGSGIWNAENDISLTFIVTAPNWQMDSCSNVLTK